MYVSAEFPTFPRHRAEVSGNRSECKNNKNLRLGLGPGTHARMRLKYLKKCLAGCRGGDGVGLVSQHSHTVPHLPVYSLCLYLIHLDGDKLSIGFVWKYEVKCCIYVVKFVRISEN